MAKDRLMVIALALSAVVTTATIALVPVIAGDRPADTAPQAVDQVVVADPGPAARQAPPRATPTASPSPEGTPTPTPDPAARIKSQWLAQMNDPSSMLVVVNKQLPLNPADYVPQDLVDDTGVLLRPEASAALLDLMAAAEADGVPVWADSGYRSYSEQVATYDNWRLTLGNARADASSARSGFSEHQTGFAVDVLPATGNCVSFGCVSATPHATWLAQHVAEFGFLIRYEPDQKPMTGYTYEPWHLRYVGIDAAQAYTASGAHSIEEFLGLDPAPDY
jgi:D-alanyl-D-alanine carboxypeptidase